MEAAGWGGPNIWFTRVPESKSAKNRVHFDLRAPGSMEEEVRRLERLGAAVLRRDAHLTTMAARRATSSASNPARLSSDRGRTGLMTDRG